jgi:preprotein translocase subunit SecA
MRREILNLGDISPRIKLMIEQEAEFWATHPESTSEQYEQMLTDIFPFDSSTLDKLFDSPSDKFGKELTKYANSLYKDRETAFGSEIMRKVERDIYLQVLDQLWMEHLENMDHLRQGIHWISVGQRDPLVEYRKQGQKLFDAMQLELRHQIVGNIFRAQPVSTEAMERVVETELTRAARQSVDNASQITQAQEFEETDFKPKKVELEEKKKTDAERRKARKAERKRKAMAKKRRK